MDTIDLNFTDQLLYERYPLFHLEMNDTNDQRSAKLFYNYVVDSKTVDDSGLERAVSQMKESSPDFLNYASIYNLTMDTLTETGKEEIVRLLKGSASLQDWRQTSLDKIYQSCFELVDFVNPLDNKSFIVESKRLLDSMKTFNPNKEAWSKSIDFVVKEFSSDLQNLDFHKKCHFLARGKRISNLFEDWNNIPVRNEFKKPRYQYGISIC